MSNQPENDLFNLPQTAEVLAAIVASDEAKAVNSPIFPATDMMNVSALWLAAKVPGRNPCEAGDGRLRKRRRQQIVVGHVAALGLWFAAAMPRGGKDARDLAVRQALAEKVGVPLIATGDALYATPGARPLHDVLTCIREGRTLRNAGRLLEANAERHLKPAAEMGRLFRACPEALAATKDLFACIGFTLDD